MVSKPRYTSSTLTGLMLAAVIGLGPAAMAADGPLRVHPDNPRYFTDESSRAIYLTGSHTWRNLLDASADDASAHFDYPGYLDLLTREGHNFIRLWTWEHSKLAPLPYLRSGPGTALDGQPKFDLERFDPAYFDRLEQRVSAAADRGLYVAVMLFQGWSIETKLEDRENPWPRHPFHRDNNVNGIDGDTDGDGEGKEVHTLGQEAVTRLQEAYVKAVIDRLNGYDNLLYEISNESHKDAHAWQHHMIDVIQRYQETKPRQHPVVMTVAYPGGDNGPLYRSPAVAISPKGTDRLDYQTDPPSADGRKVILIDSDHLWGIGGDSAWVWKSFARGLNPIYMDPMDTGRGSEAVRKQVPRVRSAMGHTRAYATRMDLARMEPDPAASSSGYALVDPGREYLVYQPLPGLAFTVDVAPGTYDFEIFNTETGQTVVNGQVTADGPHEFQPPFEADAVLYLKRRPD